MSPETKKLLEQVFLLSAVERVWLIEELLKSFDAEAAKQVGVQWIRESEARLMEIKSRLATTFAVDEAFEQIESE